ncbi:hypothetical protein [Ascidiimonas sp. W6]|uniref:hypothetical protein n=1 Tax=Ascidiimonas meishanensis TaxID=3128903 RepID=UPI0030EDE28E
MIRIEPYKNMNAAIQALDNGGRFYKIQTKANDGIIDESELENVGGTFKDKQEMILFLQMSLMKLEESDKTAILSKFDNELKSTYENHKPRELKPHQVSLRGKLSSNAIIKGFPKLIDPKSDFEGSIMFPVSGGNTTTLVMIPLTEEYDVYEVKDEQSLKPFLVAHLKNIEKLPNKRMIIGGIIKEMKITDDEDEGEKRFLEAVYYFED